MAPNPAPQAAISTAAPGLHPPDASTMAPSAGPYAKPTAAGAGRGGELGGLVPGTMIGDTLRLERKLGAGGMGVVYLARHLKLDRWVAVKFHRAGADVERLEREARAMARLSHPNVIGVYDVGRWGDVVYIAMEFVDGWSGRDWLAGGRTWNDAVQMYIQAGRGLEAAHRAGLVHRDFKPDNILIGKDGRVRVADFGLARGFAGGVADPMHTLPDPAGNPDAALQTTWAAGAADPTTHQSTTHGPVGTPAYMAPEQYQAGRVDARADQFAFAVSLYEACYGERPFAGHTPAEILYHATAGEVRPPTPGRDVPPWLRAVLLTALRKDPAHRFSSLGDMLAKLEPAPKAPLILAGAGVVVLVALLVVGGWWWSQGSNAPVIAGHGVSASSVAALTDLQNARGTAIEVAKAKEQVRTREEARIKAELKGAERSVRSEALQRIAGSSLSDLDHWEKLGEDISLLTEGETSLADMAALTGAVVAASNNPATAPSVGTFHNPVWDGKSTLECGHFENMEVRDKVVKLSKGPAFRITGNCNLRVIGGQIEAPVIVELGLQAMGTTNLAEVVVTPTEAVIDGKDNGIVQVNLVKVTVKGNPKRGVSLGGLSKATIIESDLRGKVALETRGQAKVTVRGGSLTGSEAAISANGVLGFVKLQGTKLSGPVERHNSAKVEELPAP